MTDNTQKESTQPQKKLGELLLEQSVITAEILEEVLKEQKITHERLGELLIDRGFATAEQLNRCLALQMGIERANIYDYIIQPEVLSLIKEEVARKLIVIPLYKDEDTLYVAMKNPNDVISIDLLQKETGFKIKPLLASAEDLLWIIEHYYQTLGDVEKILHNIDEERLVKGEKDQETIVIKLVNLLIAKAVHDKASDIHIEPEQSVVSVRYRIDGILHKYYVLPKALQLPVTSRLKILANLDIAERRLPQDGRMKMQVEAKEIDFRVSTCPLIHGENIVLRILDKTGLVLGLESLGFSVEELKKFKEIISSPYGIILVTGPTGSGKTTTLYSGLQVLNKEEVNIMTVEDPVEYVFMRMRQIQIKPEIGLTFASVLRSFLRQDPNIIMVGEIRDVETAQIAVQAALTGHLVFSTLHTNDAATAFTRLIDMGVEPFLVSSSLLGVLAQRLIRKICPKCKEEYQPAIGVLRFLGMEKGGENIRFYRGRGCDNCAKSGYKGRIGIYELLKNSPNIQSLVLKKASADEIRKIAIEEGMEPLRQAGIEKALSGITTLEEVLKVTQETGVE